MRALFRLLPALLLMASLGCHAHRIAPTDLERLTQKEMLDGHFMYVYDAVASLRSAWLNVHGTDSFGTPSQVWVYLDMTKLGGVSEMRSVPVTSIAGVRHYNGTEATMLFGVGHSAGVIQILSHK
jgi:hypothetical protein